jgi:predicted dehydrogenase
MLGFGYKRRKMQKKLRAGVAGAGVFGGYHAGKYAQNKDVALIGIYDLDAARAQTAALAHGIEAFGGDRLDDFLSQIEVLTIATPAFAHADLALAALLAGVHVYVEKPLATQLDKAQAMVDLAAEKSLILACGHQERCVFEAIGLYDIEARPLALEAVRQGLRATRNLDVSVVLDLMIHDLDLALSLSKSEPRSVAAQAQHLEALDYRAKGADALDAQVHFEQGFTADFKASRMADSRHRTMRLTYESGVIEVDFINRTFVNTTPFKLNPDFAETRVAKDSLGTSVERFLSAVQGEGRPLCDGKSALAALKLALRLDAAADRP